MRLTCCQRVPVRPAVDASAEDATLLDSPASTSEPSDARGKRAAALSAWATLDVSLNHSSLFRLKERIQCFCEGGSKHQGSYGTPRIATPEVS